MAVFPGIFPTSVHDENDDLKGLDYPIARLVGLPEPEGHTHVWSRTLAHLLGHALGLDEQSVRNQPGVPAPDFNGDGQRELVGPDGYAVWTGLDLAPSGDGGPIHEGWPNHDALATQDLDNDGIVEGDDNCPGVWNPAVDGQQPDQDFDGIGDACDFDEDGDGLMSSATLRELEIELDGLRVDPFPFDTDNDGIRNPLDLDDDGDGVLDVLDNCSLVPNSGQAESDKDGVGNVCDVDVVSGEYTGGNWR